jgi:hypothetical protein
MDLARIGQRRNGGLVDVRGGREKFWIGNHGSLLLCLWAKRSEPMVSQTLPYGGITRIRL